MSDNDNNYYGPKAPGPRLHSLRPDPSGVPDVDGRMRQVLGESYGGDRKLYDALGYIESPGFYHFKNRYRRGGTAGALVDKPAHDCWSEAPTVKDGNHQSGQEEKTQFEKDVAEFLEGEETNASDLLEGGDANITPLQKFREADKMARLGNYSLILIGFDDNNLTEDTSSLSNPVDADSIEGLDDVNYLSVYDQGDAPDNGWDLETDPSSPRFNRPKTYAIDMGHDTVDVHHTRVLHIAEGDDLASNSVLLRSLNRLDDLEKLHGGGAEAFWRAAYQGLVVKPPENLPGNKSPQDYGSDLERQIKRYRHNMNREIYSSGDIDTIDTNVANPKPHIEGQYAEISAGHDIPQSMIMGNETGERATEEDKAMYHEYLGQRLRGHCEHSILRLCIDRLLAAGAITMPEDPDNRYIVEWPPREETSAKEQSEIFFNRARAWNQLTDGRPKEALSIGELRKEGDLDPQRGAEIADHEIDGEQDTTDVEGDGESETDDVEEAVTNLEEVRLNHDDMPSSHAGHGEDSNVVSVESGDD